MRVSALLRAHWLNRVLEARVGVGGWGQTCTARARVARGRERVAGRAIYGIGREGRVPFNWRASRGASGPLAERAKRGGSLGR